MSMDARAAAGAFKKGSVVREADAIGLKDYIESGKSTLKFVVSGKIGVGKSSLINGMLGKNVAKETLLPNTVTSEISAYKLQIEVPDFAVTKSVKVLIMDCPGLGDPVSDEEAILTAISEHCQDADLLIYCLDMRGRITTDDASGMKEFNQRVGSGIWKNTMFVLTFANQVLPYPKPAGWLQMLTFGNYGTPDNAERKEKFRLLLNDWEENLPKFLRDKVKLPEELISDICVIPAGYHNIPPPDRTDWLSDFWFAAFNKIKEDAKPALMGINLHRFRVSSADHKPEVREETRQRGTEVRRLQQELSREREASAQLRQQVAKNKTIVQQLLSDTHQQLRQENEAQIQEKDVRIQRLQQQLSDIRRENDEQVHRLQQSLTQQQQQLSDVRREKDELQQKLDTTLSHTHSKEIEFWRVSPEDVQVDEDVLGRGGWGYVSRGMFRGQQVAVKKVYPDILKPDTVDRIRREISTMAQVRHPNLVLFIAAVLDDRTGPMIITELLDTSLRTAYEEIRLGSNKLRVFRDVASALNYLHLHRQPIIHRDVSTANVLLEAVANDVWKAKLSDFGSANLVRFATTPGEGTVIYTAPEAFPQHPRSRTPPLPQTPKIDVYSYGILVGEVVTQELPDPDNMQKMVQQVWTQWPQIHPLVTSSIEYSPDDRPTMAYILEQLHMLTL